MNKLLHTVVYHGNAVLCITNCCLFIWLGLKEFAIFAIINLVGALVAKTYLAQMSRPRA